ncbi:hypothetical protein [Chromobacterium sp. ATCC 53434]|uniref:beta strand repeat-containing protein n=1 Tax=Chromobacterium sp. (strain ATCC 53434 / SC 14030) TaxID=2059672 RepID=UPI0013054259|nr:hypothetical protein [Chromobacterium sp. ATCC 53434]
MEDILTNNPTLADSMAKVGFYGEVSVNRETGEVIIADRGTTNAQNLVTDTEVALDVSRDAQPVADAFALAGLAAAMQDLALNGVAVSAIYTTGHSLGGADAQGQAALLSNLGASPDGTSNFPAGVHITNVSLDSPGIANLTNSGTGSNYTSYNFSAQGDLVHFSGGSDLAGTTEVSLPVGPSMWSTGGLVGLGTVAASSGVGTLFSGALITAGLDNALSAHSSLILSNSISNTALGNIPISQLNSASLSANQMQNLFSTSQDQYQALTPVQQASLTNAAPPNPATPVYDTAGYDQNGYDQSGYDIYGFDKSGNRNPAIAQNGGQTNTDTFADGSAVKVVIAANGSSVETLNSADGTVYTYSRDASGSLTSIVTQGSDGTVVTESVNSETGELTQSDTQNGALVESGDVQMAAGSVTSATDTLYSPSGAISSTDSIGKSSDGSSTEAVASYADGVATGQVTIETASNGTQAVNVSGTNNNVDVDGAVITLSSNASAMIGSSADTIDVDGSGVSVTAMNATVNLSAGAGLNLSGGSDAVNMSGSGDSLGLLGGSNYTVTGSGDTINTWGGTGLSLSGSNDAVGLGGGADTLALQGGANISVTTNSAAGDQINLAAKTQASIAGSGDTLQVNGAGVGVAASNDTVDLSAGAGLNLSGGSDAVNMSGTGDSLGLLGGSNYSVTGSGDTINTWGGTGLSLSGSNDAVGLGGGADTLGLQGGTNIAVTTNSAAGDQINLAANTQASIAGSGDTLQVNGAGVSVTAAINPAVIIRTDCILPAWKKSMCASLNWPPVSS